MQQQTTPQREAGQRLYGARWRRLRAAFLRENPYCAMCAAIGKVEPATEVDHITPHKGNEDLMWEVSNLMALCSWHHKSKTMKERRG